MTEGRNYFGCVVCALVATSVYVGWPRTVSATGLGCGTRIQGFCAGCSTAGNPSDTGCRCGKNTGGSTCDCVNTAGTLQATPLTECTLGYWTYTSEPQTSELSLGDSVECGKVSTCRWTVGQSTGCATYDSETGKCVTTGMHNCEWVVTGTFTGQPILVDRACGQ